MNEIGIKYDDIEKLVEQVKREGVEIELHIYPEEQNITVRPWKPFTYNCPYGRATE